MPRGDGSGRNGAGPMTGRGLGYCAGYDVPGYLQGGYGMGQRRLFGRGRGFGLGLGYGRGFQNRRFYDAPPLYSRYDDLDEKEALTAHAKAMERELKAIQQRLNDLTESPKKGEDA